MESLHSKGAEMAFFKLSQNLDEYICSAETNEHTVIYLFTRNVRLPLSNISL